MSVAIPTHLNVTKLSLLDQLWPVLMVGTITLDSKQQDGLLPVTICSARNWFADRGKPHVRHNLLGVAEFA